MAVKKKNEVTRVDAKAKPKKQIKLSQEDKDALYSIGPAPRLLKEDRLRDTKKINQLNPEYRKLFETRRSGNPRKNWAIPTAYRIGPTTHKDILVKRSLWPQREKVEVFKRTRYIGGVTEVLPALIGDPQQLDVVKKVIAYEQEIKDTNQARLRLKRRSNTEHMVSMYNTPKLLEKDTMSVKRKRIMKYHKDKKKRVRIYKDQRKRWLMGSIRTRTARQRRTRKHQTNRSLINPGNRYRHGVDIEYRWRRIRSMRDIPKDSIRLTFRKTQEDREIWKKEQMVSWHRKKNYVKMSENDIQAGLIEPAINLLQVADLAEIRKEFIKRAPKLSMNIRKPKIWRKKNKKEKKLKKRNKARRAYYRCFYPVYRNSCKVWDILDVWTADNSLEMMGELNLESDSRMKELLEPNPGDTQFERVNKYTEIDSGSGTIVKVKHEALDPKKGAEVIRKYYDLKRKQKWKKMRLTYPKPKLKAVTQKDRLPGEVRPDKAFEDRMKERYASRMSRLEPKSETRKEERKK